MNFRLLHFCLLAAIITFFTACNKGLTDEVPNPVYSYLNVVNATDATFNVYQNGTRLNTTSNIYTLGASGYLSVLAGNQSYSFKPPFNTQTSVNPDTTFSKTLNLVASTRYSLFVCGNTGASAFRVKDSLPSSVSDTVMVRFVHAAPSLGPVNVSVNNVSRFSGISYQAASDFVKVPMLSTGSSTVRIYSSTNAATPVATLTLTFETGTTYTLFVKDTKTSSTTTASGGYYRNQ